MINLKKISIELLYVDDSIIDIALMQAYFEKDKNIKITCNTVIPPLAMCQNYDGVIVDQNLTNGKTGIDFAYKLSLRDPTIPIMLYTGESSLIYDDAKVIVDVVCNKNDMTEFGINLLSWLRQIKRIKHYKEQLS